MAAPSVGTHYPGLGSHIAEDVTDIIYQITPEDTPFFNMIGDTTAHAVVHEYQIRSILTRQHNADFEGFTYTFTAPNQRPVRNSNVAQIFDKLVRVSNTQQAIEHYAINDMFADQMAISLAGFKTDIEHALLQGSFNTGLTNSIRRMKGFLWFHSGASTFTDGVADATLTETRFNDHIQASWDAGGEPRDVLVGGRLKRSISTFTAGSQQTRFIAADTQNLVNTISQYDSDFFPVRIHLSRDLQDQNSDVGISGYSGFDMHHVDRTQLRKAWIRRPTTKRIPETADSTDGVITGELTLELGHPEAHFTLLRAESLV